MNELQGVLDSLWEKQRIPSLEGFMYSDGSCERIAELNHSDSRVFVVAERELLPPETAAKPRNFVAACELDFPERDLKVYCGEGDWGGTGFVALADSAGSLKWIAQLNFSNPFVNVELRGDEIVAENNNQEFWHFPLEKPSQIRVDPSDYQRGWVAFLESCLNGGDLVQGS